MIDLYWVILYFKLLYMLNGINFKWNLGMAALESEKLALKIQL